MFVPQRDKDAQDTATLQVMAGEDSSKLREALRWQEMGLEAIRERNLAIRQASKAGSSLREIAEVVGIGKNAVAAILAAPRELPNGNLRRALGMQSERARQV